MHRADSICGIDESVLIENAGRAVAVEIVRRYGARKTVVLCGPGNNGKDGAVAARYLKAWGWPVEIADDVSSAELIIDALYGAGLNRDFSQSLAAKINGTGVPIVSIDVPSGLDGNTGQPRGACVKADLTITFFRKKPAHVLQPGRALCGDIVVLDIGISSSVLETIAPNFWENSKPLLPSFEAAGHKFNRGHAVVVSGGKFNTGASRLAARAALQSGTGLVTLIGEADALAVQANHVTAVMLSDFKILDDRRVTAICIGPAAGVNDQTRSHVQSILATQARVVLDADALTSCANNPQELFDWVQKNHNRHVVMTPHEGEFSRLFGDKQGSKIERATKAASISGAIIILKGSDTVIAHPDGRATVNTNAPPALATAGSGDVLAGLVTGLLAQGMEPYAAACGAVWMHGEAANSFTGRNFTADGLISEIGIK